MALFNNGKPRSALLARANMVNFARLNSPRVYESVFVLVEGMFVLICV